MDTVTAGVFQDVAWARRGVMALITDGFSPSVITLLARASEEVSELIAETLGARPERIDLGSLGPVVASGPLIAVFQATDGSSTSRGLGASMRRVGFQSHDGHIFETLVARGGVLAAVHHQARAADALAKLHAYGGGNAAIGAWVGRV